MKSIFYVFLGGGIGSIFRFIISKLVTVSKNSFPWNTLFVNFIGCFLIGMLFAWAIKNNSQRSDFYLFLVVGFCGGLTTFSSFSLESLSLIRSGDLINFFSYILSSVIGGIILVVLGYYIFKLVTS